MKDLQEQLNRIEALLEKLLEQQSDNGMTEIERRYQDPKLLKKLAEKTTEKAYFAGGCFWGLEYFFRSKSGVIDVRAGYSAGVYPVPNYELAHKENAGHREVVEVSFDSSIIEFEDLARLFFEIHDFSDGEGMGDQRGFLYTSAVFFVSEEQKAITERLIKQLTDGGHNVVTEVLPFDEFHVAEDEHQNHHGRYECAPVCHVYKKRF